MQTLRVSFLRPAMVGATVGMFTTMLQLLLPI